LRVFLRQAQIGGHGDEVVLGQRLRARHQLDVRLPEPVGIAGALGQLGGAPRNVAAGKRAMPEDVAQAIAELVADLGDPLVRRPAIRARIAAVFDERDRRVGRAEDMVVCLVDRTVEPIAQPCLRHPKTSPSLDGCLKRLALVVQVQRLA
jgi:hypothetical protein